MRPSLTRSAVQELIRAARTVNTTPSLSGGLYSPARSIGERARDGLSQGLVSWTGCRSDGKATAALYEPLHHPAIFSWTGTSEFALAPRPRVDISIVLYVAATAIPNRGWVSESSESIPPGGWAAAAPIPGLVASPIFIDRAIRLEGKATGRTNGKGPMKLQKASKSALTTVGAKHQRVSATTRVNNIGGDSEVDQDPAQSANVVASLLGEEGGVGPGLAEVSLGGKVSGGVVRKNLEELELPHR